MPYEEYHITSHRVSTPENEKEEKQLKFTLDKVADLQSVLNKLHRQFKEGKMNLAAYEQGRKDIYKKFAISKADRIKFLGAKFGS